jgi:hypothetical protein
VEEIDIEKLRELVTTLRQLGVQSFTCGNTALLLGPEPMRPLPEATPAPEGTGPQVKKDQRRRPNPLLKDPRLGL